jgi:hypothetical protein
MIVKKMNLYNFSLYATIIFLYATLEYPKKKEKKNFQETITSPHLTINIT